MRLNPRLTPLVALCRQGPLASDNSNFTDNTLTPMQRKRLNYVSSTGIFHRTSVAGINKRKQRRYSGLNALNGLHFSSAFRKPKVEVLCVNWPSDTLDAAATMANRVVDLTGDFNEGENESQPRTTGRNAPARRSPKVTTARLGQTRGPTSERRSLEKIEGHSRLGKAKSNSSFVPAKSPSKARKRFLSGARQDPITVDSEDEPVQRTEVARIRKRQREHDWFNYGPLAKKQKKLARPGGPLSSPSTGRAEPRKPVVKSSSFIDLTEEGYVTASEGEQERHSDRGSASQVQRKTQASPQMQSASSATPSATVSKARGDDARAKRSCPPVDNAHIASTSSPSSLQGVRHRRKTGGINADLHDEKSNLTTMRQKSRDGESGDMQLAACPEIPESPPSSVSGGVTEAHTLSQEGYLKPETRTSSRNRKNEPEQPKGDKKRPLSFHNPLIGELHHASRSTSLRRTQFAEGFLRTKDPKLCARAFPLSPSETSTEDQSQAGRDRRPLRVASTVAEPRSPRMTSSTPSQTADTPARTSSNHARQSTDEVRGRPGQVAETDQSLAPDSAPFGSSNHVKETVRHCLRELKSDNVYWTRTWLGRARQSLITSQSSDAGTDKPTSVFRDMKPLVLPKIEKGEKQTRSHESKISIEVHSGNSKLETVTRSVPITLYRTSGEDVPPYSHHVSIKRNLLAGNERNLQVMPYFSDDFETSEANNLQEHYSLDVAERERKLFCMLRAEHLAEPAEEMLSKLDCQWSDVLQFILAQNPNVGTDPAATKALKLRDHQAGAFLDEDLNRSSPRWYKILSSLPVSDPERVGRAALLCEHFRKSTDLSFWHLARRSACMKHLLQERPAEPTMDDLTCSVCMRFNCLHHGEIDEDSHSNSEVDDNDEHETVKTDIINPPSVNHRSRVGLPPKVEDDVTTASKNRRSLQYWQVARMASLKTKPDERGPFYPCHHPGSTCDNAKCSCYERKLPCEKSCTCPRACPRKFQGCNCTKFPRKGQLVCAKSSDCACYQMERECDPDLCGDCGVCEVLDPVNRHEELVNHCRNAVLQHGVPKHTILGNSSVHGFGVYACEDIRKDDFVGEYRGEIITSGEGERRGAVYKHQKLSYLFTLNEKQEIDSTYFGNKVRFINHASKGKANLSPRIVLVNSVHRIALSATRTIKAGEELFFDYGPQFTQDMLGGTTSDKNGRKPARQSKAAPHVRNTKLFLDEFHDIEHGRDELGNVRARKTGKLAKAGRGRPKKAQQQQLTEDLGMEDAAEHDDDDEVFEPEEDNLGEQEEYAYDLFRYNIAGDDADHTGGAVDIGEDDEDEFEPDEDSTSDTGPTEDEVALQLEVAEEVLGRRRGRPRRLG